MNEKEDVTDLLEDNINTKYFDNDSGIEYTIPEGFSINELGCLLYDDDILSKYAPLISGIIVNVDKDIEKVKLKLKKNDNLKEGVFLKSQVYGSPISLSNFGIPVTASNYKIFAEYFSKLEQSNDENIPIIKTVSKLRVARK